MDPSDLDPIRPAVGSAPEDLLPGRRRRRRRSKRRRALRILEPFGLLAVLLVLSMGVIRVVETRVPTRASVEDERRLAIARPEIEALVASLEDDWIPVVEESEADLFGELLVPPDDPLLPLERDPRVPAVNEPAPEDRVDQLTTSISSTSNTSAAPPGMLGGAPLSP